jgi:hypothetical protein
MEQARRHQDLNNNSRPVSALAANQRFHLHLRTPPNAISLATRPLELPLAKANKSEETDKMLKTLHRPGRLQSP